MTWHLEDRALADYVAGRADGVGGSSVEQHVVGCGTCRARLNGLVATPALDAVWDRVLDAVQAPRPALAERGLRSLGLRPEDALLLWSAPAFRTPWLLATVASLVFATLAGASSEARGLLVFVLVAPLIPVAGVALAYGPDADAAHEVGVPTPYPALRLVLLRSLAVMVTTAPLTLLAGILLPTGPGVALAWLVPCLTTVATTLALSTWCGATRAAGVVAAAWTSVSLVVAGPGSTAPGLVLAPSLLTAYVVLGLASTVVLLVRGDRLAHLGGTS